MDNIPTAEQIQLKYLDDFKSSNVTGMMIEFAQLHVQAALNIAGYAADQKEESSQLNNDFYREVIRKCYPLTNIK